MEQHVSDASARIIQSATVPRQPHSPKKILILLIALGLSATIGIVLAFMVNSFDKSIRSPKKLLEKLGVSVLGCIPIEPLLTKRKSFKPLQEFKGSSGYTESIRSLSTSLISPNRTSSLAGIVEPDNYSNTQIRKIIDFNSHGSSAGNSYLIASAPVSYTHLTLPTTPYV